MVSVLQEILLGSFAKWDCLSRTEAVPHRPPRDGFTFQSLLFDDLPLLSKWSHVHEWKCIRPHSCFQHVTSHSWRVTQPLCFGGCNILLGVQPFHGATYGPKCHRQGWEGGLEAFCILHILHLNVATFQPSGRCPLNMGFHFCLCENPSDIAAKSDGGVRDSNEICTFPNPTHKEGIYKCSHSP